MSNIPISQIVQINPRVVSAGGGQGSLDGLLLTRNTAVLPSRPMMFFQAADVADFFGPTSPEASAATVYFAGIVGGGQQPGSLLFARHAETAAPASINGAALQLSLAQLQQLTGDLVVTTSDEHVAQGVSLAAATSFDNAAVILSAAFPDPDFVITYDATRRRFLVDTAATGPAAIMDGAATGSLADALGLSAAAGAQVQAEGVDADTPDTAMARVVAASSSWATFTTMWRNDMAGRMSYAEWTAAQGSQYLYVAYDQDAGDLTANNPGSFGSMVKTVPFSGTLPVYGGVEHAAAVMAWAAATNFRTIEGRNTLAFRQPVAASLAPVARLADANALLSNGYTYLGSYASVANTYTVFYNGAVGGQFLWSDTYLGQLWLRRVLQQALFETMLAYPALPYNQDGYNALYQGCMDVVSQALQTGVIRAGVDLSSSQKAQINTQAGVEVATTVENLGWYLQVTDPVSTTVRTERGSPVINFWYCDGGSIQKLVVSSTTVL